MHWVKKWYWQCMAREAVDIFNKKGYDAHYAEDTEEAKKMILDMIPEGSSVAVGGSMTLDAMGLVDIFRTDKYKFFERFKTSGYAETYQVIIAVGANKLVDDLPAAFDRIKKVAPQNAKRIGHHCPCVETGYCVNCDHPESVCNATSIIHNGRKHPGRYSVIVIAEELGL